MALGIGFIGLGIMGNRMLTNMSVHGEFNLAAAWDPSEAARSDAQTNYPSLDVVRTVEEVIKHRDVDVVYIASPPASHRDYALAAAAAGKAVFCEKPLGIDVEQSQEMVAAFEQKAVLNAVNYPLANSPAADLIKADIDAGKLGAITSVDIRLHFAPWPREWQQDATWLSQRTEGGFVREVGSHFIYLTERLLGTAELLNTCAIYPEDDISCETNVQAQLACDNVPVSFHASAGGVGPDVVEFTVWGEKKSYRLTMWDQLYSTTGGEWKRELSEIDDARQHGYMRGLDNLVAWKEGRQYSMASFADALSVQEKVEAILSGEF
ncbi:Gfo/Idh/MocA family oxidoreductase [uncultured Kiloniella sp.]|uniref:Gfo/Idh/MocA family protein n=1 Tax=uncultured Kiloniella sp. TaxID=1133091 RepID=UPI0026240372|nr:Gfo/Idh/MocA family oxidoreductase [uncultured Kiloniella sp.]